MILSANMFMWDNHKITDISMLECWYMLFFNKRIGKIKIIYITILDILKIILK